MDLTPAGVAEVAYAVTSLRARRTSATIVGGGTLIDVADGPAPELRLSVSALRDVVRYEPADLTVTVGAGVTLDALARLLEGAGQALPVQHPDPERATIGGLVAFGWTGLGRAVHGPLRDRVLEVHAVTGTAKLVRGGGKVVKNVTGFDLPRLFHGSAGTLGVIVEVTLKVSPAPAPLHGVRVEVDDPATAAETAMSALGELRVPVEVLILRDATGWRLEAFAPGPAPDAEATLAAFGGETIPDADETFASACRSPVLAGGTAAECGVKVGVPPRAVGVMCAALRGSHHVVVDAASGALWAGVPAGAVDPLRSAAEGLGGTLVLMRAPTEVRARVGTWGAAPAGLEIMTRLRDAFDPDRVFNRGRFVV